MAPRRLLAVPLLVALGACAPAATDGVGGSGTTSSTVSGSSNASSSSQASTSSVASSGGFSTSTGGFTPIPVRDIPGLESITYYERSGGTEPTAYTFLVDGPEMSTYIAQLSDTDRDIQGVSTEYYDVYYSDEMGNFDLNGSYLTISGEFAYALPAGGGLNLAEIGLNFSDSTVEYGNYVASFVALGDNAVPTSAPLAIDGDLQTHSTMGNTVGQSQRLRITLGFESSSGPPPS
ncbi:MAG: hypothetical protein U0414_25825 [Polyangiaceae bacterium]